MPLRKLWNAITGRSEATTPAKKSASQIDAAAGQDTDRKSSASAPKLRVAAETRPTATSRRSENTNSAAKPQSPQKAIGKRRKASPPQPAAESVPQPVSCTPAKPPRAKVSRRDPLIKAISAGGFKSPATVLEIGVGDGSRAIKVCTVLEESLDVVRYVALDQFEMGGGETKLMDFHRRLRAVGIRPQVFPEPLASGLTRVAHTIGACDLVLISEQVTDADLDAIEPQLARIAHPDTRVLLQRAKGWITHTLRRADLRRAA